MNTQREQEHARIMELLAELSAIGEQSYKSEYRTGQVNYDAIGRAIAKISGNTSEVVRVSYAALEDWNQHSDCSVLDWIFPELHPMAEDSPAQEYLCTLQDVQREITKAPVKVFTKWNTERAEYDVEMYRLSVTLEKVEEK